MSFFSPQPKNVKLILLGTLLVSFYIAKDSSAFPPPPRGPRLRESPSSKPAPPRTFLMLAVSWITFFSLAFASLYPDSSCLLWRLAQVAEDLVVLFQSALLPLLVAEKSSVGLF